MIITIWYIANRYLHLYHFIIFVSVRSISVPLCMYFWLNSGWLYPKSFSLPILALLCQILLWALLFLLSLVTIFLWALYLLQLLGILHLCSSSSFIYYSDLRLHCSHIYLQTNVHSKYAQPIWAYKSLHTHLWVDTRHQNKSHSSQNSTSCEGTRYKFRNTPGFRIHKVI